MWGGCSERSNSACTRPSPASVLSRPPVDIVSGLRREGESLSTHLIFVLFLIVLIPLVLVLVLIILVLEIVLVQVETLLKLQRLAGEPVNGAWDELLLDVLTKLVI